ncbi:MAG: LysM peptidoglycan-binding domain-containing protein [Anaerolineae bacterium]
MSKKRHSKQPNEQRLMKLAALFLVVSMFAVACERPIAGTSNIEDLASQLNDATIAEQAQPEGDAAGAGTEESTPPPTDAAEAETPRTDSAESTAASEGDAAANEEVTATTPEKTPDKTAEVSEETSAPADTAAPDSEAVTEADAAATPATTHTVAAGENLYRIGLQYGKSWVAIADANGLSNPNKLTVGQTLTIPGTETAVKVAPTPSPQTETTYTVKAGDNLFRIGLSFGISWVQIAEANGIVSPNQLTVGQALKIPKDTPGPAPQFTHIVQPGETLFRISLQYGLPWPVVAEANNLNSPYVIYSGQTLTIPGG